MGTTDLPSLSVYLTHSSASTANFLNSSSLAPSNARTFVARSTTRGTLGSASPVRASNASFHRATHRHHRHPAVKPAARRSLPRRALKSRNSSDRMPATLWLPVSDGGVEQKPVRRKPVRGLVECCVRGVWRTAFLRYELVWLIPSHCLVVFLNLRLGERGVLCWKDDGLCWRWSVQGCDVWIGAPCGAVWWYRRPESEHTKYRLGCPAHRALPYWSRDDSGTGLFAGHDPGSRVLPSSSSDAAADSVAARRPGQTLLICDFEEEGARPRPGLRHTYCARAHKPSSRWVWEAAGTETWSPVRNSPV